ncbi:Uncharacterised protein [Mycobacteroides abscessus]|nr:Uncharacterised protein [Mycobacteroides abscessus]
MVGRAEEQADPLVAEGQHVAQRLVHGDEVVARDAGEVEVLDGRVHQHDGQAELLEPAEVRVVGLALGVEAAREDHARHVLPQEQVDVLGLRHAARRAGAQHRGEPLLRERAPDDLGERREDGVDELREHEPYEAAALPAQLGRPLVAEHVERREHRVSRGLRDAGLPVEHAAHGGLADTDLGGDLRQTSRHAVDYTSGCKRLA